MIKDKDLINEKNQENSFKSNYKGIKIQTLSKVVALVSIILFFAVLYNLYGCVNKYKTLVNSVDIYVDSQEYLTKLQDASDYMTDRSRMYVLTKDQENMKQYFNTVDDRLRENALEQLNVILQDTKYKKSLSDIQLALAESNSLMEYEIHSMKLISEISEIPSEQIPESVNEYILPENEKEMSDDQKLEMAYNLVFGKEYRDNKSIIDNGIQTATKQLANELKLDAKDSVENMRTGINDIGIKIFIMMVILIAVSILIVILVVRPLKVYVRCIEEDRTFDIIGAYEFKYLAFTYNNIFEINKQNKAHMKFKLDHDTLTHVCSREAFDEQKNILSKEKIPMALLLIDVDKFKLINDTYGHEVGDAMLVRVADTLRHSFRSDDIIARVGGDEFAAILMNLDINDLEMLESKLDRINEKLQNVIEGDVKTSLSIGIAFSDSGYTDDLYNQADKALYVVKSNGRCGYSVYKKSE